MVGWKNWGFATDSSGFSIFPTDGYGDAEESYFWSSTEHDDDEVYVFGTHQKYGYAQTFIVREGKSAVAMVRCIQDYPTEP